MMTKTTAPFPAPAGRKWCVRHNKGSGSFLDKSKFPSETYSYCRDCKREYQRIWERTKRVRPDVPVVPHARLSKDKKKIYIHVPNDELGRNATRELMTRWPDAELDW